MVLSKICYIVIHCQKNVSSACAEKIMAKPKMGQRHDFVCTCRPAKPTVNPRKWLLPQRKWKKIVRMKKCQKMKMTAVEKRRYTAN